MLFTFILVTVAVGAAPVTDTMPGLTAQECTFAREYAPKAAERYGSALRLVEARCEPEPKP